MGVVFTIVILIIIVFVFFWGTIKYILNSIFIYTNLKKINYKFPLLAWVPIYNDYLFGKLVHRKIMGITIFWGIIFYIISIFLPYNINVNRLFSNIVCIVFYTCVLLKLILVHKVLKNTIPKYAILITVFNILTYGIVGAIALVIVRDKFQYKNESLILKKKL